MIKCIAIDDEPLALEVIRLHCKKTPFMELVGSFLSVVEGIDFLNSNNIDVVFLDINMPEISGLKVKSFISSKIQIVFATAYEEHALESYNLRATDYLLKPISFERFYKAAQKCSDSIDKRININPYFSKDSQDSILVRGEKN